MAQRTATGLDLGATGVRAAQLRFGAYGVTVVRVGQVELPAGAVQHGEVVDAPAVAAALARLWHATGLPRSRIVLGLSSRQVAVSPAAPPVRARPVPGTVLDFLPLRPATAVAPALPGLLGGLLVEAPRRVVDAALAALHLAGLAPARVDLAAFALLRSVGRGEEIGLGRPVEALLDVGAHLTTLVVHVAGVPRFVRTIDGGGRDVTAAIAARLGLAPAAAEAVKQQLSTRGGGSAGLAARVASAAVGPLVHEVRACLDADLAALADHARQPIHRLTLTGGGARLAALPERLRAAVGVPVELGDPLHLLRLGRTGLSIEQVEALGGRLAVPVGLALDGAR